MRTDGAFTLSAQNMAFEDGSWWLPEVEVEGRAKEICPTCGNYYYVDEPWDHVCTQECEYCYLTIASDQYEAHVQKEHSTYCLYCGQYFVGDHTCKEKDNSSGGNGGTSGNGGNSNNGTTNNSQDAYNYPYDDWNKLTPQEQEFVKKHPLAAIDFRTMPQRHFKKPIIIVWQMA